MNVKIKLYTEALITVGRKKMMRNVLLPGRFRLMNGNDQDELADGIFKGV